MSSSFRDLPWSRSQYFAPPSFSPLEKEERQTESASSSPQLCDSSVPRATERSRSGLLEGRPSLGWLSSWALMAVCGVEETRVYTESEVHPNSTNICGSDALS